jgi:phosphatidylglycerol:prolipoprotein diacylglycerol transferase
VDIITPGMSLGLAIARIGCLCAGCDYGAPAPGGESWWTLTFRYADSVRPELRLVPPHLQGVPLYPSQPLMALSLLATFAVIYPLRKRLTPWPGAVLFLYLVVEPPLRFLIEFTRGDADRGFVGPGHWLSTSQAIAAVMAPLGVALLLWRTRQPGTPPPAASPVPIDNAIAAR